MRPVDNFLSISAARTDALFVSSLQQSDEPSAGQIRQSVAAAVRQFGSRGCAGRVAERVRRAPGAARSRTDALGASGESTGYSATRDGGSLPGEPLRAGRGPGRVNRESAGPSGRPGATSADSPGNAT